MWQRQYGAYKALNIIWPFTEKNFQTLDLWHNSHVYTLNILNVTKYYFLKNWNKIMIAGLKRINEKIKLKK